MQHGLKWLALVCLASAVAVSIARPSADAQSVSQATSDEYSDKIRPIFEGRCIACHSCYNAPCQLNLQGYVGASRGATGSNVYDATRLSSVPPTRIGIDAKTTSGWREKGFFDVLGNVQSSLLLRLTQLRREHEALQPTQQVAESQICPTGTNDPSISDNTSLPEIGMPYGLPSLSPKEVAALKEWIAHGAPGPRSAHRPEREEIPVGLRDQVRQWEGFFNTANPREKLVSRYLYEHLFLAHLYFVDSGSAATNGSPQFRPQFFRLVRSRTPCDSGIDEIATRRPTDPPGTSSLYYCLRPEMGTIVEKTHIPYGLSPTKLDRIKSLFLGSDWAVTSAHGYAPNEANNPFETFAAIPVKARYQFLLDDAQYHIATFIKGPVCNGSAAVNSIQEQFFVFFLDPEADSMVMLPKFAEAARKKLILPGDWGSDITLIEDLPFLTRIVEYREAYRHLRAESVRKLRPDGYALDDIWDGDGGDANALLTVFRHYDNAAVVKGAVGDLSKTAFVLDYPLFERLVYNLAVNFDVFGNVGHQVLTRVYMDLIRMEAEELFLSFLPPPDRVRLRSEWYEGGFLTDIKLNIIFPLTDLSLPTAIKFSSKNHKLEFVQRAMFERLPPAARGNPDPINWRLLHQPGHAVAAETPPLEREMRRLASIPADDSSPFSRYFPELSLILLKRKNGVAEVYSIAHNREHENVSWIMGEDLRRVPKQDTLTIMKGVLGSYPDMFFAVHEKDIATFSKMASGITSSHGYDQLVDRFGVKRSSHNFWQVFDQINVIAHATQPIDRGVLDLTRYALEQRQD